MSDSSNNIAVGRDVASPATASSAQSAAIGSLSSGAPVASASVTMTEVAAAQGVPVLRLTLTARPTVRWDENVEDNEGMGRKSSKRCCIFHKQREFGESSTDSSAEEDGSDMSEESDSGDEKGDKKPRANRKNRKIARPKKDKVPDHQRFHA